MTTSDPSAVLSDIPIMGTAALWAQLFPVVDDTVQDRAVFRPAAHTIRRWGPHWPLEWGDVLDREAFEGALRQALRAASLMSEAVGNG